MSWTVSVICVKDVKINWWTVANLKWNLSKSLCLQFNLFRVAKCWRSRNDHNRADIVIFGRALEKKTTKKKQFVAVTFTPIMVIILHAFRIGRKGKKPQKNTTPTIFDGCAILWCAESYRLNRLGLVWLVFFPTFQIISIAKTNANWIVFMTPSCARQ